MKTLADENLRIHSEINAVLSRGRVAGSFQKLDLSAVSAVHIFQVPTRALLDVCTHDRKLLTSIEAVRSIRSALLNSDLTRLREVCESIELTDVVEAAEEEVRLILKAMTLYDLLLKTEQSILYEGPRGGLGQSVSSGISVRVQALDDCIEVLDKIENQTEYIKYFRANIAWLRNLRMAVKMEKWLEKDIGGFFFELTKDKKQELQFSLTHRKCTLVRSNLACEIFSFEERSITSARLLSQSNVDSGNDVRIGTKTMAKNQLSERSKDTEQSYEDISSSCFFVSDMFMSCKTHLHAPESVAKVLIDIPTSLLCELEREVLHIRNCLYDRIAVYMLQVALEVQKIQQRLEESTCVITVVKHIGVFSESAYALYNTVCILKDLRNSISLRRVDKVLMTLRRANQLKVQLISVLLNIQSYYYLLSLSLSCFL